VTEREHKQLERFDERSRASVSVLRRSPSGVRRAGPRFLACGAGDSPAWDL